MAGGGASTGKFEEFSTKWRTRFSHLHGGSENQTVVPKLGNFVYLGIAPPSCGNRRHDMP
ncbi:hypothetical protein JHV666_04570 [Mycobacterium avium subsp. hominissuis]|uniref:Uncharacterized protein n=1 Tax=Mycobacterium indicus pranii (strain DSM 45239 / MTCC 9506) TaxID=1232724 RepID=J9WAA2_MYCIP|nr:Hypothetical protein MIP_00321 [Mycobacterium intracellulare subsp. intracellulare MTCC 9506]